MSTKSSISYKDGSHHLYREMDGNEIQMHAKCEWESYSNGWMHINLSSLPPDLIAALAKQLTKMAEGQK